MHKISIVDNLYSPGNELKTLNGLPYAGYYHIENDGSYVTGRVYVSGSGELLIPLTAMPQTPVGDLISEYADDSDNFEGTYSVLTIKNYKNDIDIVQNTADEVESNFPPITITDQPDVFFKKNTTKNYIPGKELFIDENRNIQVKKGMSVELQFGYESADDPNNIKFDWRDSFDRTVSDEATLLIDTNLIDGESDTFSCTISDSFGTDITNEITITVIDPDNHPIFFNNIVKNGSALKGVSEWETTGDKPEEVGKFLSSYEPSKDPNGLATAAFNPSAAGLGAGEWGSIYYHKFTSSIEYPNQKNKNHWYPRPEIFDAMNNFNSEVANEIKDNYFRGGNMDPVLPEQNNHSGTSKSSIQIIDLSEYADLISGKIYGIEGFRITMFGWLGGRADQGDECSCELEFLDENDVELPNEGPPITINSLSVYDRIINEVRNAAPVTAYQVGTGNSNRYFSYTGLFYDGNDAIELPKIQAIATSPFATHNNQGTGFGIEYMTDTINAICKTIIVGKASNMVLLPINCRKIKVTKYYLHKPGKYDLIFSGKEFADLGIDYKSEAMIVGLNVRLYPILIDQNNNVDDTGVDSTNGQSIITGMNMETLPVDANAPRSINDYDLQIESVAWLNPLTYRSGVQLFDTRLNSDWAPIDDNGNDNPRPVNQLGPNVTAILNPHFKQLVADIMTEPSTDLHTIFMNYGNLPNSQNGTLYNVCIPYPGRYTLNLISLYTADLEFSEYDVFDWNGAQWFSAIDPNLLIPS